MPDTSKQPMSVEARHRSQGRLAVSSSCCTLDCLLPYMELHEHFSVERLSFSLTLVAESIICTCHVQMASP